MQNFLRQGGMQPKNHIFTCTYPFKLNQCLKSNILDVNSGYENPPNHTDKLRLKRAGN